jgi:hypothetical protein
LRSKDRGIVCIPTTLFSQIRRPSSPSPMQRSTPIRTDQNDLHNLALTDTPTQLSQPHSKVDPIRIDQNDLHNLALADMSGQLSLNPCKCRPQSLLTKTIPPFFLTDTPSQLSPSPCKVRPTRLPTETIPSIFFSQMRQARSPQAPAKADPHAYRPKQFQPSCSHRCAQQLSHCPWKGRTLHLPTKTHVNKLVLT